MLYFGQYINNKNINSKFRAERLILEAVYEGKVNAKSMRIGNLSARFQDGEFQINYSTNSFMGRLKSYKLLGACPYSRLDNQLEFSPIDEVSRAIVLLATTPKECTIFHPFNHHFVLLGDIFTQMSDVGFRVEAVEDDKYANILEIAKQDSYTAKILSSMMAYENTSNKFTTQNIGKNNSYTMQVLYRLGYHWSSTSWDYIRRFLLSLQGLGFFEAHHEDEL